MLISLIPRLGELVVEIRSCSRTAPTINQNPQTARSGKMIYLHRIWLEFGVLLKFCEAYSIYKEVEYRRIIMNLVVVKS